MLLCLFGLWLVGGLVASSVVSGSGQHTLVASLEQSLGVPVSVGAASFDLGQWFLLRPAISLADVSIGNPSGFRSQHLLEAKRLSAQVSLLSLLRRTIEVRSIVIDHPRIVAETNREGIGNIEALVRHTKTGSAPSSGTASTAGLMVDNFSVASGEISYFEDSNQGGNIDVSGIDLHITDFSKDQPFHVELSAKLFRGNNSRLHLAAQAGPIAADSLPLDGALSISIAPDEMPPAYRRIQFGKLLAAPGKKARAGLEVSVKGDAYKTLSGPAKLIFSDLLIGKDEQHVLPLSGEAPVTFAASRLMSTPGFQLNMSHAQLHLGKGEWTGSAEIERRASVTSGKSAGRIQNVDINQLVSAITAANEKIYGVLEIPYSLEFSGKNADQIRDSLRGSGKLSVVQGRIAALDLLASIQDALEHPQQALTGKKGGTPFTTLASDLRVANAALAFEGIQLNSPALRLGGSGVIHFDQTLNFKLDAHVTGGTAQLVNRVSGSGSASGEASLPLTVTGTVESPQVRPSVGKIVTSVAEGLLNSFLKKKTK